jgi:tRNA threonylcarbamoyladenosine modification (KEOPS) complex  Pcc1 subunit
MFASLKTKAQDEDWMGKAKAAATQATAAAQQAAGQATAMAKQQDQSTLEKSGPVPEGAVWRGISHEAGRNSVVTLYPDRIERTKPTSKFSVTGVLTGGAEDVEVIPTKSISSVQVRRGAWYHDVTIYASGNTIVLSVDAADAEKLRGLVMDQVLQRSPSPASGGAGPAAAPAAAAPSGDAIIEQIKKLGELRDAGLLTPEEFEAKKADLLGRL